MSVPTHTATESILGWSSGRCRNGRRNDPTRASTPSALEENLFRDSGYDSLNSIGLRGTLHTAPNASCPLMRLRRPTRPYPIHAATGRLVLLRPDRSTALDRPPYLLPESRVPEPHLRRAPPGIHRPARPYHRPARPSPRRDRLFLGRRALAPASPPDWPLHGLGSMAGPASRPETRPTLSHAAWPGRGDNTAVSDPARDANGPGEAAMIVGGDPQRVPAFLLEWNSAHASPHRKSRLRPRWVALRGLTCPVSEEPFHRNLSHRMDACGFRRGRAVRTHPGFGAKSLGIVLDSGRGGEGRGVAIAR